MIFKSQYWIAGATLSLGFVISGNICAMPSSINFIPRSMANAQEIVRDLDDKILDAEKKYQENIERNNAQFQERVEKHVRDLFDNRKHDEARIIQDNVARPLTEGNFTKAYEQIIAKKLGGRLKTAATSWERTLSDLKKKQELLLKKLETETVRRIDITSSIEQKSKNLETVNELKRIRDFYFPEPVIYPANAEIDSSRIKGVKITSDRMRFYVLDEWSNIRSSSFWEVYPSFQFYGEWVTGATDVPVIKLQNKEQLLGKKPPSEFIPCGKWRFSDKIVKFEWTAFKGATASKSIIETFVLPINNYTIYGKSADGTPLVYRQNQNKMPVNTNPVLTQFLCDSQWILTTETPRPVVTIIEFAPDGSGIIKDCKTRNANDFNEGILFKWSADPFGRVIINAAAYDQNCIISLFKKELKLTRINDYRDKTKRTVEVFIPYDGTELPSWKNDAPLAEVKKEREKEKPNRNPKKRHNSNNDDNKLDTAVPDKKPVNLPVTEEY